MPRIARAFTLVEILIVVVILGIVSAIVVPQFSTATEEATLNATFSQLQKLRNALSVYYVRNGNVYPNIAAGDGTWGELLSVEGYLRERPENLWVGEGVPGRTIVLGNTADPAWQNTHGWIFDNNPASPTYGQIWAGSFDGADSPYPRP
jgi:prepilin-type N-terminal cleavage/methylation domain-containing protein